MPATWVNLLHTSGISSNGTADAVLTGSTVGANFLLTAVGEYDSGVTGSSTLADSVGGNSNTWTALTLYTEGGAGNLTQVRLYYVVPTYVGASHSITIHNPGGGAFYPGVIFTAWSGAHATPFDKENGAESTTASSQATGAVTPVEDGELIVSAVCGQSVSASSIDSGLTILENLLGTGGNLSCALAWKAQSPAALINPTWTMTGSNSLSATVATFKVNPVASGGTGGAVDHSRLMLLRVSA